MGGFLVGATKTFVTFASEVLSLIYNANRILMRKVILSMLLFLAQVLYAQNDWLTRIDDKTPVAALSIPGTHNSATGNGLVCGLGIGVTQQLTIDEQWELGIRAVADEMLNQFDLQNVCLRIDDRGALECVLRARIETAILRAKGEN